MQVVYSKHSLDQLEIRKIEKIWVEEAIKSPDKTLIEEQNKYIIQKKLNGKTIEVVYIKEKYIKIVTVYWI